MGDKRDQDRDREELQALQRSRREFLVRVLKGTAYVAPVVATFLAPRYAFAQVITGPMGMRKGPMRP